MADVVIVGAGVIGLTCAYELARRGMAVTVLDKGPPGGAASSGNAGWVTPAFSAPLPAAGLVLQSLRWMLSHDSPLHIRPWSDPRLLPWLWSFWRRCNRRDHEAGLDALARLNRRTGALFDQMAADGITLEMERLGVLFACETRQGLDHVLADLRAMERHGYPGPRPLGAGEVCALEPNLASGVVGGVLVGDERHVRPERLCASLVDRLTELGGEVRTPAEVTGFERRGTRVTGLATSVGRVTGERVVVATGAWSGRVAGLAGVSLPVQAGKGYSVTVESPAITLQQPLYLTEAKVACTSFRTALRIAGTMELTGVSDGIDPRRVDAMARAADRLVPGWRRGTRSVAWAGLRPLTPDGLPLIGRAPGRDNLFVATGHGMLGVTLAPTTGIALAELITMGRTSGVDLSPFDPGRFG